MKHNKDFIVGDIGFNAITIPKLFSQLTNKKNNSKGYITVSGASGVVESYHSDKVKRVHNESMFTVPDGMPIVWIGKNKGLDIERCYGPDLMEYFLKESSNKHYKHFFYGGKPGVAEILKEKICESFDPINIVGTYTPPFRPLNKVEELELIDMVDELKPDFFWVGISCPKQEIFMNEMIHKLNVRYMFGVGYAFDVLSGKAVKTPKFIQKIGMEWFFRMVKDPLRLTKRYLYIVPFFIFIHFKSFIKKKK
tara:strand:- start:359 stop:1111 length:753 start_codon:yes stop_codon:yes gene_type:complete